MTSGTTKAHELAKKQRVISVAEFFSRNRHLLGFDNPRKALLTTVKEAVDNALDACEEAEILPELTIEIFDLGNDRFRVAVEDNGPGILKSQVPNIFGKMLYGSKFFKLSQSRGQQGIGISAAVLYGQLTTNRPARITTKISPHSPANYFELTIDTKKNKGKVHRHEEQEWEKPQGTKVEIDLEGTFHRGVRSVDAYLLHVAIVNPHATIFYAAPDGKQTEYIRVTESVPPRPKEIKPHLHGVELGRMMKMLELTKARTLQSFLTSEFTRVGAKSAKEICQHAALLTNTKPRRVSREMGERLMEGIKSARLMNPPTDCLSPIGEHLLEMGLRKEINAEFFCSVSRPAAVYRGNPFQIEVGIAYGGEQKADSTVNILRFANRVPLLYQQGACAISKSISSIRWSPYGLRQSQNSLPVGPCTLLVHMSSVWVPFTSESKEAIAHYPEILKELKLALQDAGRKLQMYVKRRHRVARELKKRSFIEKYIPHVGLALQELLDLDGHHIKAIEVALADLLEKHRGSVKAEPDENIDFDEDLSFARLHDDSSEPEGDDDAEEGGGPEKGDEEKMKGGKGTGKEVQETLL